MPDYEDGAYQGVCTECHYMVTLNGAGLVKPHRPPHRAFAGFDGYCRGSLESPLDNRPVQTVYLPGDTPRPD